MIIESIKLQNFGRHAALEFNTDASVVGVLGVNGQGKSTILEAIKYGLTGLLRDSAESYMRDGGKHGKTMVSLTFRKHGKQGTIERGISASRSTRTLKWDGQELKSAKEVDAVMSDLLNADKRSVLNCVFVPQGHLSDLLFGDKGDREKMFLRMLGCSHFDTVAKAAQQEAAFLRSGVQDLEPAMRELDIQQDDLTRQFRDAGAELLNLQDSTPEIVRLEQLLASGRRHAAAEASLIVTRNDLARETKRWTHQEHTAADVVPAAQAVVQTTIPERVRLENAAGEAAELQAATLSQESATARESLGLLQVFWQDRAALDAASAVEAPPDQTPALEQSRARMKALEEAVREAGVKAARHAEHQKLQSLLVTAQQEADTAGRKRAASVSQAVAANEAWQRLSQDPAIALMQTSVSVLEAVVSTGHADACPVCQSSDLAKRSPADLQRMLTTTREYLRTKMEAVEHARIALKQADMVADLDKATDDIRRSTVIQVQAKLSQLGYPGAPQDPAEIEMAGQDMRRLGDTIQQAQVLQRERERILTTRQTTQEVWNRWVLHPLYGNLLQWTPALAQEATGACVRRDQEVSVLRQTAQQHRSTSGLMQESSLTLQRLLQQVQAASIQLADLQSQLGTTFNQEEITGQLSGLRASQAERQALVARRDLLSQQTQEVQRRRSGLEQQVQQQTGKMQLAQEMEQVAQVFGRDGVLKPYMHDMYGLLMSVVVPHLETLGAPFTVRNTDAPLSFEFRRTDEESEWMLQGKLSGGQRVKMSAAFLLALQQVIIPDVGLLVMDEPTTHLDQESRESFRDLLEDLGQVLERRECQVIVCDHCQEILPALRKRVEV